MAETDVQQLLASIPQWVQNRDAAALAGLRNHQDKQVRKAVRKAIHSLKSRGIEVPTESTSWSTGNALQSLRGDLTTSAVVDTHSSPGALRFALSQADDVEGGVLMVGAIGPDDRLFDFHVHTQTDGQRGRTLRDWKRETGDRAVDVEWLKGRILWGRQQAIARGFQPPQELDRVLPKLGPTPSERPRSFIVEHLKDETAAEVGSVGVMEALRIPDWPAIVDLDSMLERAAEIHGDKPQPTDDDDRMALLGQSMADNTTVREALATRIANVLDDCAVSSWLSGDASLAKAAFDMAAELRHSAEPERVSWAPRLIGYQVASLLRMVGGPEAVRKAMAEEQARLAAKEQQEMAAAQSE